MRLIITLLLVLILMTTACSRPSPLQAIMDEQFREVADLESEVHKLRETIAGIRTNLARLEAESVASRDVTPPAPRPDKVWRCATCGKPMWLDDHVDAHHADGSRDHPAKLSDADMKTIVDGLRMGD